MYLVGYGREGEEREEQRKGERKRKKQKGERGIVTLLSVLI